MSIRTLGDRIAIRQEILTETEGGVIIANNAVKTGRGHVVAVGAGKYTASGKFKPTVLKKGDYVIFSKEGGDEMEVDGEKLLFLVEDSILSKISEGE